LSEIPRDQVAAVLELLEATMAGSLLGAYLYGSAVDGGLRPDSDLDLLGVVERRLHDGERRSVIEGVMPLSGRGTRPPGWRPLELTLVVRDEVRPWRYPPRLELQYGEWLRPSFVAGVLEPWPATSTDVAVLVTLVLAHSEVLVGPPAAELLAAVPRADLVRAMSDELPSLRDDLPSDTRNVLLTLARMWMTVETGQVRSKDVAAEWAIQRLPAEHRPALEQARAAYVGEREDAWDDLDSVRAAACWLELKVAPDSLPPPDASV
jgi:streptomycin 3"-adenylyltransferase